MSSLAIEAGSRRCVKAAAPSAAVVRSSLTAASTAPVRGSTRTIDPRRPPRASRATRLRPRSIESRAASPLGPRRQPLQDPGQEARVARVGLDPAPAADGRAQGAVSIEEERAGAGLSRLERAEEPRPEAARRERHGALRGERAGPGLVAPLEGEGRRVQVPERVAGAAREVGERSGGVEAFLGEGRQHERLGREGFEIGEGNDLGGHAPRPRRRDGSSRAGRDRSAWPAPGARERDVGGRRVAGQETLPPPGEVGGSREREPGREGGGGGEGHEAPRREPAEVARRLQTVPVSQALVRAPASRATWTPW